MSFGGGNRPKINKYFGFIFQRGLFLTIISLYSVYVKVIYHIRILLCQFYRL